LMLFFGKVWFDFGDMIDEQQVPIYYVRLGGF
jgi:hypothetical protein